MAELSISERTAWLHRSAVKLKTTDLTTLRFALRNLIEDAGKLLDQVDGEIKSQRQRFVED